MVVDFYGSFFLLAQSLRIGMLKKLCTKTVQDRRRKDDMMIDKCSHVYLHSNMNFIIIIIIVI